MHIPFPNLQVEMEPATPSYAITGRIGYLDITGQLSDASRPSGERGDHCRWGKRGLRRGDDDSGQLLILYIEAAAGYLRPALRNRVERGLALKRETRLQ
jgi:hypothetical protein